MKLTYPLRLNAKPQHKPYRTSRSAPSLARA